jgi:hypothetical protein
MIDIIRSLEPQCGQTATPGGHASQQLAQWIFMWFPEQFE